MAFRDSTVVIIETGRTIIRAVLGLQDLLKTPSVDIRARVGLRKSALGDGNTTSSDSQSSQQSSSKISSYPQVAVASASVNDYLVGTQLDEALSSGQDIIISWPFAEGDVFDWTQAEALWKYVLFNQLQRRRAQNESPVLLSFAPSLPREIYERICQVFFERFNVAGLAILERPIAQLYATNNLSGLVVDIGQTVTDITAIYEGFIAHGASMGTCLGISDCQIYLAHLLRSNQSVMSALAPPTEPPIDPNVLQADLLELSKQIWTSGLVKVPSDGETAAVEDEGVTDIAAVLVAGKEKAVIESGMKKKATAKASAAEQARAREIEALDLVTIQFREHSLTLGKERHRFCEPLFDPSLIKGLEGVAEHPLAEILPLQEAAGHIVGLTDVDQRQYIWQGLFVTGVLANYVKGIGTALQSRLAPYILSNPDQLTDIQTRTIRVITVPEYFAEYRDKGDGLAAFLGSSIVAKITFNDSMGKNFVSKADYTSKGPHAIIEMSPSLL